MAGQTGDEGLRQRRVSFPCGKLTLEGLCYFPERDGVFPAVVVCHPHPLYGGSMDNNVVLSIGSALAAESIIALMFNFRGVGGSQGSFGGGKAEQEDAAAAINWIIAQPEVDGNKVGLAGYSFGAAVVLPVACADDRVRALALVSLPPGAEQISQLKSCAKPKLLICGTNDMVVPLEQAQLMNREAAEPKQFELISGADHIWWGYEAVLAEKVANFFKRTL
ncbi:MAG: dienelactone hydrolase family protein [Dehalococcoidia bacterium]|nr:dienelactone hydrolase family protein [Dehalococcoidia bacterium]